MTYTVEVTREGSAWLADVPALPGAHTYARNLASLQREIDDVIRVMADLDEHAPVATRIVFIGMSPKEQQATALRAVREDLVARERQLLVATVLTASQLVEDGVSVRDAAGLLGLTHGRISQLASMPVEPDAADVRSALIDDWRASTAALESAS